MTKRGEVTDTESSQGPAAHPGRQRPPARRGRLGRRLMLLAVLMLAALVGVTTWALTTASGFSFLYAAAQRLAPGVLTIRSAEGALSGPLTLNGVQIRSAAADVDLEQLVWDWYPSALLTGKLHVGRLSLTDLRLALKGPETPADTPEAKTGVGLALDGSPLPLSLLIDAVQIERAGVASPQLKAPLQIDRLALQVALTETALSVTTLNVEAPPARFSVTGNLGLAGAHPVSADFEWSYRLAADHQAQGHGRLRGDLATLELEHMFEGVAEAHLSGTVQDVLADVRWRAILDLETLSIRGLDPTLPAVLVAGKLSASGSTHAVDTQASLTLDSPEYGRVEIQNLDASFDDGKLALRALRAIVPQLGSELIAEGAWTPGPDGGTVSAQAEWRDVVWPLVGESLVKSPGGVLRLSGKLESFDLHVDGRVTGPDVPATHVVAKGNGNIRQAAFPEIRVQTLDGIISAAGSIAWAPDLSWELQATARELKPSTFWKVPPGRLAAKVRSQGRMVGDELQASLALLSLDGQLRELPVSGAGKLKVSGDSFEIPQLELRAGASRLSAAGSLDKRWKLQWELESPDIGALLMDARGELAARGSLAGPRHSPDIRAQVQASDVAVAGQGLKRLAGDVRLPLSGIEPFAVNITAENLVLSGRRWRSVTVRGRGEHQKHQIFAAVDGDLASLSASLEAGLGEANRWRGEIVVLNLNSKYIGDWRMVQSTRFDVSARAQTLETLCLVEARSRSKTCGSAKRDPQGALTADLEVVELALAVFKGALPAGTELDGTVTAEMSLAGPSGGALIGNARITVARGIARLDLADTVQQVDFSQSSLETDLSQAGLRASLDVRLKGYGGMQGQLSMPGWSTAQPARPAQPLEGSLRGKIDNLSVLSALVPDLAESDGKVDIALALTGVMEAPRVQGKAQLLDGRVEIPALGLRVSGIGLEARSAGLDAVQFTGQALSGNGRLSLSGQSRLVPSEGFPTTLTLRGEEFVVADIPEAWVPISPDLTLKMQEDSLVLSGELTIGRARLRPRSQPEGTVGTSPDVVVLTAGEPPPPRREPKLYADIRLRLGDQVSFEGFGLRTRFEGNLLISQQPQKPAKGNGQVNIREGTYRAYGQDLTIDNGRIIFADSPVDNPGLDIRATRKVDDVTAGVRVSGTLKNPKLKIFSDPAMTQAEALSYLVLGAPLERGAESSTDAKQALADQAAIAGGGLLATEVGRQLGLDDVRLERGRSGEDLSLLVGTYLSPKLYAQYVTALRGKTNRMRLRYDLTRRIQIQSETGDAHGIDAFYKIER